MAWRADSGKGIYRDAVRSSKSFFVKTSGLRWVSMMVLTKILWVECVWALPFLTILVPSERYHQECGVQHKKLTDWVRQMIRQVRRWLTDRTLVMVVDSSYAMLDLLAACVNLRLDAALYDPVPERQPGQQVVPRRKRARQPSLAQRSHDPATPWQTLTAILRKVQLPSGTVVWYHSGKPIVPLRWVLICDPLGKLTPQALLCTDLTSSPAPIVVCFFLLWQLEVTFEEERAHLDIETQRQWSLLAILRTTPAFLALFSLVALFAHHLLQGQALPVHQAVWYQKAQPTFPIRLPLFVSTFGPFRFLICRLRRPTCN